MIHSSFSKNQTVDQIIRESVKDVRLNVQKQRREWVRKMLDYYGGNYTSQYIEGYFDSDSFREIPTYNANFTRRFINKIEYARKYRFQLCPENAEFKGYCTEKILHAFASGCIPIYWGDDTVIKDFNEKAFINANSKTIEQVISEVM